MANESYDIIIIGSGAGGGTIAHTLAGSGAIWVNRCADERLI